MHIARIDDEHISAEGFVKTLKLDNAFSPLIEQLLTDKLAVHAARKAGVEVTPEELQQRVDQFRRTLGLHRAQETLDYLEALGVELAEFEAYMSETLYREKILAQVTTPAAIEEYFRLHSPKFDAIEVSHIVVDSEAKARELLALLEDDPDSFAELAREHSLNAETRDAGGHMGKFLRGALSKDAEAKVFNAEPGALLGPFASDDELLYEIFRVEAKHPAKLDATTSREVAKIVYQEWLQARAEEHNVQVL